MAMAVALLAGACSRAPAPPTGQEPGADAPSRRPQPQVTVSGDEAEASIEVWTPPLTEPVPEQDRRQVHARARLALAEGRLIGTGVSAVPLYLALQQADPQDRAASQGLLRARQAVVDAARAELARGVDRAAPLLRASELAAAARWLAPEDPQVRDLQLAVDLSRRVMELCRAGEEELAEGHLGLDEPGALENFRQAQVLAPMEARALQGIAAVESAVIDRAEAHARQRDFAAAETWLERAARIRADQAGEVLAGRQRVEQERARQVAALHDLALAELDQPAGLRAARTRLAEAMRIAQPGNVHVAQLRERIDLATHYGQFRPGQVFSDALADGSRGPQLVVVPHGGFRMGAEASEPMSVDAEKPAHYVRFDRGFAMTVTEVTVAEFGRFVAQSGTRPRATRRGNSMVYDERSGNFVRRSGVDWRSGYDGRRAGPDDPVLHVSVHDAEAYAAWLTAETGRYYRLPSEAEFEYALRAGTTGRYPWGNQGTPPEGAGNFAAGNDVSPSGRHWNNAFVGYADGYWGPAPVGHFQPNSFGLHDLAGNVSEWVADCWHASYRRAPADGAAWYNPGCRTRVVRGGSWAGAPAQTRAAWRSSMDSDMTSGRIGFRLVRGI
jgi:formylglycine-generating enzyme required for sulfatase activity